jgi:collagenase-like PrtC family protease
MKAVKPHIELVKDYHKDQVAVSNLLSLNASIESNRFDFFVQLKDDVFIVKDRMLVFLAA